jgi:hypothetical protein
VSLDAFRNHQRENYEIEIFVLALGHNPRSYAISSEGKGAKTDFNFLKGKGLEKIVEGLK